MFGCWVELKGLSLLQRGLKIGCSEDERDAMHRKPPV